MEEEQKERGKEKPKKKKKESIYDQSGNGAPG